MQYDGSIRINTNIRIKEAEAQLATLENRMKKAADRITSLRSKMDALKDAKIPTQAYKDIESDIAKSEKELSKLIDKQAQMQNQGKTSGAAWDTLNQKIQATKDYIDMAKEEMQVLVNTGEAFTLGSDTEDYAKLSQQLQYAENDLAMLNQKHDILEMKQKKVGNGYKDLAAKAKSAFNAIGNVLKKANSTVNAFGRKIRDTALNHLPFFRKETEKVKGSLSGFKDRLKSLTLSFLLFNQISKAFRAVSASISAGFANMYNDDVRFKASIDDLKASVLTLQNAFAAAFRPFLDMALPYIQKLVEWLTAAVNLAGQFFAALTGRKTYTRAIKQTAAASEEAAKAAEEETEAINRQLSPLDDLNNLASENNKKKDKGKDDNGSGIGIMFEEVPIDSNILEMADRVRDILSKLFVPLKEAWEREGKFVIDSWKYGLAEVWKLIKDIGRDFLTVWQQEKTIKIFEDLLHIIGDIGVVRGHLARNFREAWNENKTGFRILENVRDIIGVIVHNFRLAADATVKWADKLNFKPLLEAFERFTKSLIPLAGALSGILADFYTEVLLPLSKWTIEKGLPELLDVFIAFNEKVDWEALRKRLSDFWKHLEPFAETIGEGLILFIERVSDALAEFINSEAFDSFLTKIEEWMDSVTPEDVADALEMIAKGIIALKAALLGFSAISALAGVFTTIISFFGFIASFGSLIMRGAGLVASGVGNIIAAIGGILPALAIVAAAAIGWKIGEWINENLLGVDTPSFFEMMDGIKSSFLDGSWQEALHLWGEDIKSAWTEIWGYVKEDFERSILGGVFVSFTDGSWKEALHLWGEDIKSAWTEIWGYVKEDFEKSILGGVLTSFKDNTWKDALKLWKNDIYNAFVTLREKVSPVIDQIMKKIGSLKSALESAISGWNGWTGLAGSNLFSSKSSSSAAASASPYAAMPAYASLADMPIPGYATGQVIPRSMKQHLAVLGDNNQETEIVSPVSTMKQAFMEAFAEVGLFGGNNGGGTYQFSIDGRVFFEIMQKYAEEYKIQSGGSPAFG